VKLDSLYDWRPARRTNEREEGADAEPPSEPIASSVDLGVFKEKEPKSDRGDLVLLIEDDPELAQQIRFGLEASGYTVQLAESPTEGLRTARLGNAAVLVIDRLLGGENGLSIVQALRSEGKWTPALVISGLSSVDERIAGLKAGCDDFLVKPFDVRELSARVEALSRRGADMGVIRLRVGDLEMDLINRTVRNEGRLVDLVPREFQLLEYFMRRPGQAVTRAMLLEDVWNFQSPAYTNIVDVQIGNLRRKLDPTGERRVIVSVRSVGFKLNARH